MAKKSGKIMKAKSVGENICRKSDVLKEKIRLAAADSVSLQSISSSQAGTICMKNTTTSISALSAALSKTVISTDESLTSHQPSTSKHSLAENNSGQPADATSNTLNSIDADPSLTNPESYTLEALEENINFEELQSFVDGNFSAYFHSDQIIQDFLDFLEQQNFEDFNFPFNFDENK